MLSKNKLDKQILFILFSGCFLVSNGITLNLSNLHQRIGNENSWIVLFFLTLITMLFTIRYKFVFTKKKLLFLVIWELFLLSVNISKYLHNEFSILEFLLYAILVPMVFLNSSIIRYRETFIVAIFISVLPYFYLFAPWNTLAILITIIGVTGLAFIVKKRPFVQYSYIIIFFLLIFLTEHRTSIITLIIIIFSTIFIKVYKTKIVKYIDILKMLIFLIIVACFAYLFYDNVLNALLNKWSSYNAQTSDIASLSSGRTDMWETVIKSGTSLLGNGETYFNHTFGIYHAHNHVFQILGAYGILSLFFFLILVIFILLEVFKHRNKLVYVYFFSAYFIVGLTEYIFFINTFFIYPSILFFVLVGSLFNEKRDIKVKCS
ncbi:O-antigen ligase family protein [Virgibacillus sp. 6R]|uniref:O-antigen ligase family protein n=1 Tax=Metabacillus sp. 22489 TaxID=3453928 RepID=UPI0021025B42